MAPIETPTTSSGTAGFSAHADLVRQCAAARNTEAMRRNGREGASRGAGRLGRRGRRLAGAHAGGLRRQHQQPAAAVARAASRGGVPPAGSRAAGHDAATANRSTAATPRRARRAASRSAARGRRRQRGPASRGGLPVMPAQPERRCSASSRASVVVASVSARSSACAFRPRLRVAFLRLRAFERLVLQRRYAYAAILLHRSAGAASSRQRLLLEALLLHVVRGDLAVRTRRRFVESASRWSMATDRGARGRDARGLLAARFRLLRSACSRVTAARRSRAGPSAAGSQCAALVWRMVGETGLEPATPWL